MRIRSKSWHLRRSPSHTPLVQTAAAALAGVKVEERQGAEAREARAVRVVAQVKGAAVAQVVGRVAALGVGVTRGAAAEVAERRWHQPQILQAPGPKASRH